MAQLNYNINVYVLPLLLFSLPTLFFDNAIYFPPPFVRLFLISISLSVSVCDDFNQLFVEEKIPSFVLRLTLIGNYSECDYSCNF